MLAGLCSKSFKLGFSSMWTENIQMYKLSLEKTEEPEIKLPTFTRSWRMQGDSRKTSTSASLTVLKSLIVWIINKLWKILQEMEIPDHFTCLLRNLYADQEATVRTGHETMDWFQSGKGIYQGCIVTLLINFYSEWSECSSVMYDPLQPHGLSMEFSRPEYWRG